MKLLKFKIIKEPPYLKGEIVLGKIDVSIVKIRVEHNPILENFDIVEIQLPLHMLEEITPLENFKRRVMEYAGEKFGD